MTVARLVPLTLGRPRAGTGSILATLLVAAALHPAPACAQLPIPTTTTTATTAAPPPPVIAPAGPADSSTGRFGDASGRNWVAANGLTAPLGALWRVDLGSYANYPVIADGKVFVERYAQNGSIVDALDLNTGAKLWETPLQHIYFSGALTFAPGRLIVLDAGGGISALDPATGTMIWKGASDTVVEGTPTIAGDAVVVQGNGGLLALALADGAKRWSYSLGDGTGGSPAASGDRVYLAGPCAAAAVDRRTGAALWRTTQPCDGGGGGRMILTGDRVANTSTTPAVQQAADGAGVPGVVPLVATDQIAISRSGDTGIQATDLAGAGPLWRGDGSGQLLGLGDSLFQQSGAALNLRDLRTGAVTWAGTLADGAPGSASVGGFDPAPAAGGGVLVVPDGNVLVALAPAARTVTPAVTLAATKRVDVLAAAPISVKGSVPGVLARTVQLQADEAPFSDSGFAAQGKVLVPDAKAAVSGSLTPLANVRVRLAPTDGTPASVARTYYVFPKLGYAFRQRDGRVFGRLTARGRRVSGRTIALYLVRRSRHRATRLAVGRLHGGTTARAAVSFRPVARLAKHDFLIACVEHAERYGMGRKDYLQAHCGQASFKG